jgi:hypothetical protein
VIETGDPRSDVPFLFIAAIHPHTFRKKCNKDRGMRYDADE